VQGALGKSMLCEQSCIKNCSNPSDEDIAVAENTILAWELAFINKMAAINKNTSIPYEVDYFSERSTADLVSAAGAADGQLIVIGYICMVVFGCITLFNMDLLQSRVTLGFGGMILVILSIVAAMGFSAAVGIFYVPTIVQVLPFLALGLGTYDMFVMAFTFNYVPDKTVPAMIGDLLKECGPRLLLTCTTNIIVFGIGTNIPLPAVSLFAGAMCIVILFNFLILVIGFSALIALNAERMRQNKLDCCCCVHAAYKSSAISTERAHQIGWCPTNFAKLMFHPISQIFVFVATVVIFAVGMWGIPQVQIGLPLQDIVPKDFYAYGFLKARTNFYNSGTSFLVTGYRAGKSYQVDHKSPKFHADVLNLEAQLQALPGSDSSFPVWSVSWVDTFLYWAATSYQTASGAPGDSAGCTRVGTSNDPLINVLGLSPTGKPQVLSSLSSRLITIPQNWTRCFSTFLGSSGIGSVQYLEMDDNYEILSSRIPWFQTKLDTDQKIVDYIVASRALTDASPQPVFPSGNYYDLYEQYVRTREYLGSNLGFTAIGVILIIWCFLFHPGAVLIMFAVIVITVAEIVGFLAFFNLKLNGVSVVNIISGIGVINPPIAHITRVFLVTPGTNAYRAEHSLASLTFPMLFSTISTFVGEFPMEFARFPYFTLYFFYMYVLIGILTIINAFLPLPLILAYLGPGYFGDENSPTGNPDKPQPYEKGGLVEIPGLEDSNAPTNRTS
jgi:Niemann-Pick C1 protein